MKSMKSMKVKAAKKVMKVMKKAAMKAPQFTSAAAELVGQCCPVCKTYFCQAVFSLTAQHPFFDLAFRRISVKGGHETCNEEGNEGLHRSSSCIFLFRSPYNYEGESPHSSAMS